MATKAHRHSRRTHRRGRHENVGTQRLVALLAQTLASIVLMVVARLIGVTTCGGR